MVLALNHTYSCETSSKIPDWLDLDPTSYLAIFTSHSPMACRVSSDEYLHPRPHRFLEYVRSEIQTFCDEVFDEALNPSAFILTYWPTLFVASEDEARVSSSVR
jgi:hypothetical protein